MDRRSKKIIHLLPALNQYVAISGQQELALISAHTVPLLNSFYKRKGQFYSFHPFLTAES